MSYIVRRLEDGSAILEQHRAAAEIGFRGPIGPLPEHMATQVAAWRSVVEEGLAGTDWTERASVGFSRRGHKPVLIMQAVPLDPDGAPLAWSNVSLIFLDGTVKANVDRQTAVDWQTDQVEWSRVVIGVERLEAPWLGAWVASEVRQDGTFSGDDFADFLTELRRREAEGSQAAQEALRLAGLEPNYAPAPAVEERASTDDGPAHVGPASESAPTILNYETLGVALERQRDFVGRELSRLLEEGYAARFYVGPEDDPRFVGTLRLTGVDEGTPRLEWTGVDEVDVTTLDIEALKALCEQGNAKACAELDRRGVEPPMIEPDGPPIPGDEVGA